MMYLVYINGLRDYEVVRCSLRFGLDSICQLSNKVILINHDLEVVGCNFTKIKNINIIGVTSNCFTVMFGSYVLLVDR